MKLGIERLAADAKQARSWGRCALLCNQASLARDYMPSWEIVRDVLGERLVAFLGPQHGFHAVVQDNMIESEHGKGPFGLPVYSLYSETREPTDSMLDGVDTIIVDLQFVGCRVYTFKYTMAGCLRAAKRLGKHVVVLDRPNPLGGRYAEGRVLDLNVRSFVGEYAIPLRHGLTSGEAAQLFNESIAANLTVIPMEGWQAEKGWQATGLPWILTSPNLPTVDSVMSFPATVLFEGTNVSEGRGTGLPFQFIGAPYLRSAAFVQRTLEYYQSPGLHLRPAEFQPTSQKWAGEACYGLQIHLLDSQKVATYKLGLALARAAIELGQRNFAWKQPPYEYEYREIPINLILGAPGCDQKLLASDFSLDDAFWYEGLESYCVKAKDFLIYDRELSPLY